LGEENFERFVGCISHVQSLPFVEYELHKQLVNKLKIKGMNSLFRLKIQISVGLTQLVAIAVSRLLLLYHQHIDFPLLLKILKVLQNLKMSTVQ